MQQDTNPQLTSKQRYWLELIQRAQTSGLSLGEFANTNNLNLQQLYQYRYALRKKGLLPTIRKQPKPPLFEKVSIQSSVANRAARVPDRSWLYFPNGLRLEFSADIDCHLLALVIEKGLGSHATA